MVSLKTEPGRGRYDPNPGVCDQEHRERRCSCLIDQRSGKGRSQGPVPSVKHTLSSAVKG